MVITFNFMKYKRLFPNRDSLAIFDRIYLNSTCYSHKLFSVMNYLFLVIMLLRKAIGNRCKPSGAIPSLYGMLPIRCGWLGLFLILAPLALAGPTIGLVSKPIAGLPVSVSAAGDSYALNITPNGQNILFLSSANNLITNNLCIGLFDLYLQCRTNGVISLISANIQGTGGNDSSYYGIATPDGRFVVFESDASDLVTNDFNESGDIFVRDVLSGTTRLVSVNRTGSGSGNGNSSNPVITPDGRYVAFVSEASDLVAGDENGIPDIFVRDMQTEETILISVGAQGGTSGVIRGSDAPAITPDGRFVAFTSAASNLVANAVSAGQEIYVRDLVANQTLWASQNASANTQRAAYNVSISDDGKYVAFKFYTGKTFQIYRGSLLDQTVALVCTNAVGTGSVVSDDYGPIMTSDGRYLVYSEYGSDQSLHSIWLWDGQTQTKTLASVSLSGQPLEAGICDSPAVTPDGRYVAFLSNATNLVANPVNGEFQAYVRDLQSGVTTLASADPAGAASGSIDGSLPSLSADGRFLLFDSRSGSLCPEDLNECSDVLLRDLSVPVTELVSRAALSMPTGDAYADSIIGNQAMDASGRYLVFTSESGDLAPGDTNKASDIFVCDLQVGSNTLVSINQAGTGSGNGASSGASISANGRYVVFTSFAGDLVPNDTNELTDIFVRDLETGATRLVSARATGESPTSTSHDASISADGRYVAYLSSYSDTQVTGSAAKTHGNALLRDLVTGTTRLIVANTYPTSLQISPDGRYVSFFQTISSAGNKLSVFDAQTGLIQLLGTRVVANSFSGDGTKLVYIDYLNLTNYLVVVDLAQGTNVTMALGPGNSSRSQALSVGSDGRWATVSIRVPDVGPGTNQIENVCLCDIRNANLVLASVNQTGTAGGNGASIRPRLSSDGRYVAFRGTASDLVANDVNGLSDVFLFDHLTGNTSLLSHGKDGVSGANGFSLGVAIAPDAKRVVFTSAASNLVDNDWNNAIDVFALEIEHATPSPTDQPIRLSGATQQDGRATIRWTAVPGNSYRVQYADSLQASNWQDLPGIVTIVGASAWLVDEVTPSAAQRFYRVRTAD